MRPFPDVEAGQWPVSTARGRYPVWAPDGREVFFLRGTQLMAVPVQTDTSFIRGTPEVLFDANYFFGALGRNYDVAPDGRFLMVKEGTPANDTTPPEITIVLNRDQELLEPVPVD